MGVVAPADAPAMASLVDGTSCTAGFGDLIVLIRDDTRGREGFGFPFLPFGPLGLPLAADAPCWAAPPFFVLRLMMVLWCVRVLDSKNKLLRFVQPFFA
jgi:hypothetical protein